MKVIILAGVLGTRLSEYTESVPKPMVIIGGKPILWHIMKTYAKFEIKDFYIALGYKAKIIKEYFLWLFKKLKVKNNEDIYKKINTVVLGENSGRALCDTPDNYYKTTNFRQIIIKNFPQKKLIEWQFFNKRRGIREKK